MKSEVDVASCPAISDKNLRILKQRRHRQIEKEGAGNVGRRGENLNNSFETKVATEGKESHSSLEQM